MPESPAKESKARRDNLLIEILIKPLDPIPKGRKPFLYGSPKTHTVQAPIKEQVQFEIMCYARVSLGRGRHHFQFLPLKILRLLKQYRVGFFFLEPALALLEQLLIRFQEQSSCIQNQAMYSLIPMTSGVLF